MAALRPARAEVVPRAIALLKTEKSPTPKNAKKTTRLSTMRWWSELPRRRLPPVAAGLRDQEKLLSDMIVIEAPSETSKRHTPTKDDRPP